MTKQTEVLKLALEALTATMATHGFQKYIDQTKDDAITALREALAEQPAQSNPLPDELIPKPEWANTQSDWVVMYLRKKSIFDADQIGAMLDFAAAASATAHGIKENT